LNHTLSISSSAWKSSNMYMTLGVSCVKPIRCSVPQGRLLLTTPYHGYLKNLLISALGKCDSHYNPLWDCGHIKFWSRRTLSKALEETGFENIQFYGAGRFRWLWKSMVLTSAVP
jgi:hypothetical protein